ncbi:MAG: hypothetical protein QM777_16950 [Pseudorhodoferax sp.]
MANGRNPKKRGHDSSRDPGGFVALPWAVLDSPAYLGLSHPARSLLLELARQLRGDDNGRLVLSRPLLAKRGWKSVDVIQRAKQELLDAELIFETAKGQRPNKASWYAVTWYRLGKPDGFDFGADRAFVRGAYRKNAPLSPSRGQPTASIGPSHGQGKPAACPSHGPMRAVQDPSPCPSHGHPLDKPSTAAPSAMPVRESA